MCSHRGLCTDTTQLVQVELWFPVPAPITAQDLNACVDDQDPLTGIDGDPRGRVALQRGR